MSRSARGAALAMPLALALAASPATAQDRVTDTPADRFGSVNGQQVQISTGTDDDTLTFRAELPVGLAQPYTFSLIASRPLHGGDDQLPTSLDALANGTKITLRLGQFRLGDARPDARAIEISHQAQLDCDAAQTTHSSDPIRNPLPACIVPSNAVHTYALSRSREYVWHTVPAGALDWGIDASIGINEFEWVDPVTFAPQKAQHTDWSIAGHIAQYFGGTAITGSVSYQRAYEATIEQQLCPPNSTNPADCITARSAGPSRKEHFLISAGVRYRFTRRDGRLLNLAIAPQVTYDVQEDIWGVDVPIYFIPGANGGLNGGVRVGYRSDRDDEFSIGVFMGTTFDLLGG